MRVQTEQVAYMTDDAIEVNERILPASIRHKSGELHALLAERFADAPHNRSTRRQIEREVTNWIQRTLQKGLIHVYVGGPLEIDPAEFPPEVRDDLGELVERLNTRFADDKPSPIVVRRMSAFAEDWIEGKLDRLESDSTIIPKEV